MIMRMRMIYDNENDYENGLWLWESFMIMKMTYDYESDSWL